jgi:hypothetical protein
MILFLQCIRFGYDYDPDCMKMDELLYKIADDVKNFCVIYLVEFIKGKNECFDFLFRWILQKYQISIQCTNCTTL